MSSLHYLFHVAYHEQLGMSVPSPYPKLNKALALQKYEPAGPAIALTEQSFEMRTLYPGLLIGLGYPHEVKNGNENKVNGENETDEAINLGFFLDYTTGLPYIPGSTVKGILRSAFRKSWTYILENAVDLQIAGLNAETDVHALEAAIFGEWCKDTLAVKDEAPVIDKRDIFFDAIPVKPDPEGYLLNTESITPHRKAEHGIYIGMKNPTPLKLLKVRPLVHYLFRFKLQASVIGLEGVTITAAQKMDLFKRILFDLGAAAKTNVGFGAVDFVEPARVKEYKELTPANSTAVTPEQAWIPTQGENPNKSQKQQNKTEMPISARQNSAFALAYDKAKEQKVERTRK